jgi:hypothetical protein
VDKVHGALLLYDCFSDSTETRVEYRKPAHSIALTEWLLSERPESLGEIGELLRTILG